MVSDFKAAAKDVLAQLAPGTGSSRMRAALEFWEQSVPAANIEEYYILVDRKRGRRLG